MSQVNKQVQVDPVTIATTWHFMQRVCREMYDTVQRTASNVLAVTLHDLAYGIWDATGRAIAIPEGFPNRLLSSGFCIRAVIKQFGDEIYPGDEFLTNHPFISGAVHLSDWVFIRPVFYKEELLFFTCMGAHVPDNGGAQPGGYFLAHDAIAEGLNIPPVKIVERGKIRDDMFRFILANNRLPDLMRREMVCLTGSTALADRRLVQLLDKYGKETVLACIEEMIHRTENAVRAEIAKWPDGTYCAEEQTDDDGIDMDKPVTVRCKLTIKGDEATFDFSESDDQQKGYINYGYAPTLSNTLITSFLFLDPWLSAYHNEGSLKPFTVVAREGSVVNAKPGALTAASPSLTGALICRCVFSVLSQALPQRAIGCPPPPLELTNAIGPDPKTGQIYVFISFCPDAGAGAVYGYDGYQCFACISTLGVVTKTNVEDEMVRFPWRIRRCEFMTDSHGAGKWRSAPGVVWEAVNEGPWSLVSMGSCDGWRTQSPGQQGGYPTLLNKAYILRGAEQIEYTYPHTMQNLGMGDTLLTYNTGGAGVGFPEERDPGAVKEDVENELVSLKMARDVYKVALNPDTMEIDRETTKKLRERVTK